MPSILLIHGGSTSARYWDRLLPLLPVPALAPDLPGRGERPADLMKLTVEDGVAAVVEDVSGAALADPIVLVAHSSGGLVVPGVLRALGARVGHLVYSSASVPPEGGCGLDCMRPRHAEGVRKALEYARSKGATVTTLDGPAPDREKARTQYGGDPLDDALVDYAMDPVRRVPDSFNVYLQPISWQGVDRALPCTYIRNLRDRAVPLELQDEMIERIPLATRVVEIDGGHVPSMAQPETIAELLAEVCETLAAQSASPTF